MVEELLLLGADPWILSNRGWLASSVPAVRGFRDVFRRLRRAEDDWPYLVPEAKAALRGKEDARVKAIHDNMANPSE